MMVEENAKSDEAPHKEATEVAAGQGTVLVGSVSAAWDEDPKKVAEAIRKSGARQER